MSDLHLRVRLHDDGPMRSITVKLQNRDEAFLVAQRYDGPAELWDGDTHICTIRRTNDDGIWVLSNEPAVTSLDTRDATMEAESNTLLTKRSDDEHTPTH